MMLYQKQLQNSIGQSSPLAQIMKMNMQLNALKLLAQEASETNTHVDNSQLQLLATLKHINQANNATPQLSKLLNVQTHGLITPNKSRLLALMDAETLASSTNSSRLQSGVKEEPSGKIELRGVLKPNNIPTFNNLKSQGGLFNGHELDERDFEGLNSNSKKM